MNQNSPTPENQKHDTKRPGNSSISKVLEDQWDRYSKGDLLQVEEYFSEHPDLKENTSEAVDIIYNDFVLRYQEDATQEDFDSYYQRFPQYKEELENQFQMYRAFDKTEIGELEESDSSITKRASEDSQFELTEKLGEGGFARVYRAWDDRLKRFVAIKLAKTAITPASRLYKRFEREAKSVARLSHPGIVPVYDFGTQDGRPYMVCQIMEGGSMSDKIEQKVPIAKATQWMISICKAIDYAHNCGVVHRDIKPGNILFNSNEEPLVSDFGLASLIEAEQSLTRQGEIIGTPAYMSPEQAKGNEEVGTRSDVYSIGVVLYLLICGRLPFHGRSASVMRQTINEDPPEPRSIDSTIPLDLQTICLKAMAKEPEKRYTSAANMAEDLIRFSSGKPILARPVGMAEKIAKWIRRYPAAAALIAAITLFAVFSLGGMYQYSNVVEQRDRATKAEESTKKLLANEASNSAQLAMRQGQTENAARLFKDALERGVENPEFNKLLLAKCELINGNIESASKVTSEILSEEYSDELKLLKCQLALLGQDTFGDPLAIIESIQDDALSASDQKYVAGLKAANSAIALDHFKSALALDNFHHGARRMANIMALSLAEADYVIELCNSSRLQFPDDDEFLLVQALAFAIKGKIKRAGDNINATSLLKEQKDEWMNFADRLCEFCEESDLENRHDEFELSDLLDALREFRADFLPLITQRHWFLPPRIGKSLNEIFKFTGGPTFNPDARRDALAQTALTHPEASLGVVIGTNMLAEAGRDTLQLVDAQIIFDNAIGAKGFINGVETEAIEGAFAVAIHLAAINKHEVEENRAKSLKLLERIDPENIEDPVHLRTMTIYPMQSNKNELAETFAARWIQVARDIQSQQHLKDSLWHMAVIKQISKEWYDVIALCDEMMALDSDGGDVTYQPIPLRASAIQELAISIDLNKSGFDWEKAIESSIDERDWQLALTLLGQIDFLSQESPDMAAKLKRLRKALNYAQNEEWEAVKELLTNIENGKLSNSELKLLGIATASTSGN